MSERRVRAVAGRPVRSLVALGDSTTLGMGDRVPGGGWRGFARLLADALGGPGRIRFANLSTSGARVRDVHDVQLPAAMRLRPDAAVLVVGMNDTLRSDFDPVLLLRRLDVVVGELTRAGAVVVTARYHDHGRVFRLPAPLRRALRKRIDQVNAVLDEVVARHGAQCVDLDALPGAYELGTWSVDRLHPSELGHRRLARAMGERLAAAGCRVPESVSLRCSGGVRITAWHHLAWLVFRGVPWLVRRGSDLLPHGIAVMAREVAESRRERRTRRGLRLVEPMRQAPQPMGGKPVSADDAVLRPDAG
ncbi:SGNH/GDSL hydrolase family protein [Saccharopolyspora gloriosae]|uniref:SGNH/GDSL hydrolase family protein n=1 Tax=Saccharopolyspora gloriosae TaxID=455344 RepID=UPI001FB71E3D|nr:SGNH/GDSL hydrolase family protein [Saccharopolyspora gloriosae]